MKWIQVEDHPAPKTEPFLACTVRGSEMMEWKESMIGDENPGWYGFYCPCACCGGHCSADFGLWMPLPKSPV